MAAVFQQVLCAIATMVKRTLHEDGTDHQSSSIDSWGRSWKGDTDASSLMEDEGKSCRCRRRLGRPWECGSAVAGLPDVYKEKSRRK